MGLLWIVEAMLLGCLLVYRFTDLAAAQPSWAGWLLVFGAGAAGGMGLASALFFLLGVVGGIPAAAMMVELAGLAAAAWMVFRGAEKKESPGAARYPMRVTLWLAALSALALATAGMAAAWQWNPQGNWDAWAIWNLRARFLSAGGGLASRAWSPALAGATHTEYPLLVSSFVARCWAYSHALSQAVPAAASYAFFLALIALAAGGLAALRGPALGLSAGLVLLATPALLREVPAQYADVPLACYVAGAVIFALLERPVLAGVFAGLAAWTKDEGLLFLAVFLAVTVLLRRRTWLQTALGALPAAVLALAFKAMLPKGTTSLLSASAGGAGHRVVDFGRAGTILAEFGRQFASMGVQWYHPILPLAALAVALRFDGGRRRDLAFGAAVAGLLLLGESAVYMVTANSLEWQLQTSLGRLLVQVWPVLVVTAVLALRQPERLAVVEVAKTRKKQRG